MKYIVVMVTEDEKALDLFTPLYGKTFAVEMENEKYENFDKDKLTKMMLESGVFNNRPQN